MGEVHNKEEQSTVILFKNYINASESEQCNKYISLHECVLSAMELVVASLCLKYYVLKEQ